MPLLAVLAASAQVGDGVEAALLEEEDHAAAEGGRVADVEAAVPGEEGGALAVGGAALRVHEEHGDEGAVARGIAHQPHAEAVRVHVPGRARPELQRGLGQGEAIDGRGDGVGREPEEGLAAVPLPGEAGHAADDGQVHVVDPLAGQGVEGDPRGGVAQPHGHDPLADERRSFEDVG